MIGSEILPESDREDDHAFRSGHPSPDGSLEAREREDSVGLLSPLSSRPSPRASLHGSHNGIATSLGPAAFPAPVCGIRAQVQVQVQAVVRAHDTIPIFNI